MFVYLRNVQLWFPYVKHFYRGVSGRCLPSFHLAGANMSCKISGSEVWFVFDQSLK